MSGRLTMTGGGGPAYGMRLTPISKALNEANIGRIRRLTGRILDKTESGHYSRDGMLVGDHFEAAPWDRVGHLLHQARSPGTLQERNVAAAAYTRDTEQPGQPRTVFGVRQKMRQDKALMRQLSGLPSSPVRDRYIARSKIGKAETTMSDAEAHRLAGRYDTRGPLPKGLDRDTKMKAYEARYIASGGRKAEKWKHRADRAEVGRNVGLAGATLSAGALLARRAPGLRRIPAHRIEAAGLAAGFAGGASELYGEHARSRRASYAASPGGVAGSALTRMQAYTPTKGARG